MWRFVEVAQKMDIGGKLLRPDGSGGGGRGGTLEDLPSVLIEDILDRALVAGVEFQAMEPVCRTLRLAARGTREDFDKVLSILIRRLKPLASRQVATADYVYRSKAAVYFLRSGRGHEILRHLVSKRLVRGPRCKLEATQLLDALTSRNVDASLEDLECTWALAAKPLVTLRISRDRDQEKMIMGMLEKFLRWVLRRPAFDPLCKTKILPILSQRWGLKRRKWIEEIKAIYGDPGRRDFLFGALLEFCRLSREAYVAAAFAEHGGSWESFKAYVFPAGGVMGIPLLRSLSDAAMHPLIGAVREVYKILHTSAQRHPDIVNIWDHLVKEVLGGDVAVRTIILNFAIHCNDRNLMETLLNSDPPAAMARVTRFHRGS